ncbi:hypothetical protein VNO77_47310 [Canavalia gladiata]|uniref:Secreted protein n=1 Tax=Canavalia gladiata TaxID=3824 RepID=A0AAN9PHP6_CANGL
MVFFVAVQGVGLLLDMLRLLCSSFLDIFGTVLEPCSEMFLLVSTQIWILNNEPQYWGLITSTSPHVLRMDLLAVERVAQKQYIRHTP